MAGRRTLLLGGLTAPLLLLSRPSWAFSEDPAAFNGQYRWVGGKRDLAKQHAAIDEVCAEMNVIFRKFARPRLIETLAPKKSAAFKFTPGRVRLERSTLPTIDAPIDGSPIDWSDSEGNKTRLRLTFGDGALRIRFRQKTGDSTNTWKFKDDGRLVLRVKIDHNKLPKTLSYSLNYKRS